MTNKLRKSFGGMPESIRHGDFLLSKEGLGEVEKIKILSNCCAILGHCVH